MVRVIEGKIVYGNDLRGKKLLRVSGTFELSRVRVTGGKITVNVRRKSKGNRLWFELARVRVIGSQLFADRAFLRETFSEYVVVDTKVNEVFKLVAMAAFDFLPINTDCN